MNDGKVNIGKSETSTDEAIPKKTPGFFGSLVLSATLVLVTSAAATWGILQAFTLQGMEIFAAGSFVLFVVLNIIFVLLLAFLTPAFTPKMNVRAASSRFKLAGWVLGPALLMPFMWGAYPQGIWRHADTLFHGDTIVNATVTESKKHVSMSSRSWRSYHAISYKYFYNDGEYQGFVRSGDNLQVNQQIPVKIVSQHPGHSALVDNPMQWRFFAERFMLSIAYLYLANLFLCFAMIEWRKA